MIFAHDIVFIWKLLSGADDKQCSGWDCLRLYPDGEEDPGWPSRWIDHRALKSFSFRAADDIQGILDHWWLDCIVSSG